jgi:membrane-bound lytic murein transglycosylase D
MSTMRTSQILKFCAGRLLVGVGLALLPVQAGQAQDEIDLGDLLDTGARWVQKNLPDDVLTRMDLPDPAAWQTFWARSQQVLESGSLEEAADLLPYVETAARLLDRTAGGEDYAAWLRQRVDYFEVAGAVLQAVPDSAAAPSLVQPAPAKGRAAIVPPPRGDARPGTSPAVDRQRRALSSSAKTWKKKLAGRPPPGESRTLVPLLKRVFKEEGVPPELVWLAEVESSMNPRAKNPGGATGLFQFMPATAKRFGLETTPVDERKHPGKSARAAARYLKFLYSRFDSWALALAAYNAGEGRVRGLLTRHGADTFEEIAPYLPLETRLYVPKVEAVIGLREGVSDLKLPAPTLASLPDRCAEAVVISCSERDEEAGVEAWPSRAQEGNRHDTDG